MRRHIFIFILIMAVSVFLAVSCREEVDKPHEHDFDHGDLVLRVEPLCFTDGCVVTKCRTCEAEHITVLPAYMTHISDEGTIQRVGDHDLTYYRCKLCGELLKTVKEHRVSEDWSYSSTTHWHDMACGCEEHVDETNHFFSDYTETYEDGCYEIRVTTRTCVTCGYETKSAISSPSHEPGEPDDDGIIRCTECGQIIGIED